MRFSRLSMSQRAVSAAAPAAAPSAPAALTDADNDATITYKLLIR